MSDPRAQAWKRLNQQIIECQRCPRLREYCQEIALKKRSAYADWNYWGRPVPNFGDPAARFVIVGLAPAAHGGNRTGRVFTGDRSGDWLYRAMHQAGFANQATAVDRNDGLQLIDCAITNPCHCAPPANKPTREEITNCSDWFQQTMELLPVQVILALGQLAWQNVVEYARAAGWLSPNCRRPKFAHGAEYDFLNRPVCLIGSFHPSPRNTFTGRLTEPMFDAVFAQVRRRLGQSAADHTG